MLLLLDYFFFVLHVAIIAFMLTGWVFPKTQKAHLVFVIVTLVSWLIVGAWIGTLGYCFLTDWHWDVKRQLGESALPNSFTKYLIDKTFGIDSDRTMVDVITAAGMVFGTVMTIVKNVQRLRKKPAE